MSYSLPLALVLLALFPPGPEPAPVEHRQVGTLFFEDIPEIPETVLHRTDRYLEIRSADFEGWHPDGKGIWITTRFSDTEQVHFVEKPGGARRQLTFFKEPASGVQPCPAPGSSGFLFSRDTGGNENYQIYYFDMADGSIRPITSGPGRNGGALWSNGGDRFVYYSTRRNGQDWDLYVDRLGETPKPVMVMENTGAWIPQDWSPDDCRLLVMRRVSINESYAHILDLETGTLTDLNPENEQVAYRGRLRWAKDGKGLYYCSDRGGDFQQLRYRDLESGEERNLTADIPWDVESFTLSRDGKRLVFSVNRGGISTLYAMGKNDYEKVAGMPTGLVRDLHFHPDGRHLAMSLTSSKSPGDVFVLNLGNGDLVRWTHSEVGGLATESFVDPELIEYPTFDTVDRNPRHIPVFYYRPEGEGPFPVAIRIHGGPEGQFRPGFNARIQRMVKELGIAVLAPNVRGSRGYGKAYLELDNGYLREDSVKDIGALIDWIGTRPELDGSRVAVIGGSYGGYMVLASMIHFGDRLRCGVDSVGISNFVTFLKNTKPYRRDLRRVEYGDERIPEMHAFLQRISPTARVKELTRPLLVIQGKNDPRVPVTESEQMVRAIRENGGRVWYLMAEDEGHGFSKKNNQRYSEAATALFLETHLLQSEPSH